MEMYRKDFPFFAAHPELVHVDSATTSHKPLSVINAMRDFYARDYAATYRSMYKLAEKATAQYESVRSLCARFLGAQRPSEIVFTRGATEGINIVATCWAARHLKPGDEILLSEIEHHANILAWQRVARARGAVIRWLPYDPKTLLALDKLDMLITPRTKLIAVTAYSNVLGSFPGSVELGGHEFVLAKIREHAQRVGARVLVDAAQLAPHAPLNVEQLGCDFLVFSAHKMLGPQGIGVLYVHRDLHSQFEPYQLGGGMVLDVQEHGAYWRDFPHLFDAGTQPIAQIIGFGAALEYLMALDRNALRGHEAALCSHLIEGLKDLPRVQVLGPRHPVISEDHLVSFIVDGMHPHDVAAYLDLHDICVRAGNQCAQILHKKLGVSGSVRASFYLYTTHEEVGKLLKALSAFK